MGFYLAFGFLYFSEKKQKVIRLLCQLPFVLPSLFSILICLDLVEPFPYGHWGVVFIFCVVHLGFATIYLADVIQNKILNLGQIAKIYNLKTTTFYLKIIFPLMKKEIIILSLIIFMSCLASLSIPLIAGGGRGTTLEVYIFEKIFIEQKWFEALVLAGCQALFLFIITSLIYKNRNTTLQVSASKLRTYFESKLSAAILILLISIYVGFYLYKTATVFVSTHLQDLFDAEFFLALQNSVLAFFALTVLFILFSLAIVYAIYRNRSINILNIFLSPSTVLIGFGLYILLPTHWLVVDQLKIVFGLCTLFFVGLYRSYLAATIEKLKNQTTLANIYNIEFKVFLIHILWPVLKNNFIFAVSLLYLISVSEFAVIKAAGSQLQTVGTLTELYLNSYRLDQAYILSFFSLCSWGVLYLLLRRVFYVHQKS